MENLAVLRLNLACYQRLLETVNDPTKRHMVLMLIAETEAGLRAEASVSVGADRKVYNG